jgi:hypothetical protein
MSSGWSTWDPQDDPLLDMREELLDRPGGGEDDWTTYVPIDAAKTIAKDLKLPDKEAVNALVTVVYDERPARLTLTRGRAGRRIGKTLSVDCSPPGVGLFPDLAKLFAEHSALAPVREASYHGTLLADFGMVRPRGGYLTLTFAADGLSLVAVGPRFVGSITTIHERDDEVPGQMALPLGDEATWSGRPEGVWLEDGASVGPSR